jgi:4-hydroxyacetophenone monooxygenase
MDPTQQVRAAAADGAALRAAVADADIVPLAMSLVQLTGRTEVLDRIRPYIAGGWNFLQSVPPELQDAIRAELVDTIEQLAAQDRSVPTEPPEDLLGRMMEAAVGQAVPDEYRPLFREEMCFGGVDRRAVAWRRPPDPARLADFPVVIVGAGLSGVAMAIKLKEAGIPYTIIEKNDEAGGTWLENVYPGCGVDTPCHFYSYAFETNCEWTEYFAKRGELLGYLLRCVEKYGVRDRIRFSEEVVRADWDEVTARWTIRTRRRDGSEDVLDAKVFVTAVGALNRPAIPDIPGLTAFAGPWFHTGAWDQSVDLTGKRVAMIGTGASGMQVGPSIAPDVARLTILQRSPHWAIKHPLYFAEVSPGVRWAMRHVPFYANWFRFQLFWAASDGFHGTLYKDPAWDDGGRTLNAQNAQMREQLVEHIKSELGERTDLLEKVTPDYPPFGKRMLRDNHWYQMLKRPNVELVTGRVDRVEPDAVVSNGVRYPADVIVLATGFQAARMLWPMAIAGRDGVSLRALWGDDNPRAHLGITVPGFPNFFMIYGPNTNLAHGGSAIFHSECQVRYVMLALREMIEQDADSVAVRPAPFEAYNARLDAALAQMSWSHPRVTNWYKNAGGRVVMNSPWRLVDYRNLTADFDTAEYEFGRLEDRAQPTADALRRRRVG